MNNIKSYVRRIVRFLLCTKNGETVHDSIIRHRVSWDAFLCNNKISLNELRNMLIECGIKKNDTVILHSSFKGIYNVDAQPEDIIEIIMKIVGPNGTLVMPCYGKDENLFDLYGSQSAAGIITERFRTYNGVKRSCFPKFSMCALGKNADNIINNHINSKYQFDENSPYFISMDKYNAKIILLGLKYSHHKISVFHCASYQANKILKGIIYSFDKHSRIVVGDKSFDFSYKDRLPIYQNNNDVFIHLFNKIPKVIKRLYGLEVVVFDSRDGYRIALEYCLKGNNIYKF